MGTNYYLHLNQDPCPTCGHDISEVLHIGKSSAGWCFSLNTHEERGIDSLKEWKAIWPKGVVRDEYGRELTLTKMLEVITRRWRDDPCDWTADMYVRNHAVPGPNNLVRHMVDGSFCIAHGPGTYDLMRGEFS